MTIVNTTNGYKYAIKLNTFDYATLKRSQDMSSDVIIGSPEWMDVPTVDGCKLVDENWLLDNLFWWTEEVDNANLNPFYHGDGLASLLSCGLEYEFDFERFGGAAA